MTTSNLRFHDFLTEIYHKQGPLYCSSIEELGEYLRALLIERLQYHNIITTLPPNNKILGDLYRIFVLGQQHPKGE